MINANMASMATTIKMPTPTPALKMPSIKEQLDTVSKTSTNVRTLDIC